MSPPLPPRALIAWPSTKVLSTPGSNNVSGELGDGGIESFTHHRVAVSGLSSGSSSAIAARGNQTGGYSLAVKKRHCTHGAATHGELRRWHYVWPPSPVPVRVSPAASRMYRQLYSASAVKNGHSTRGARTHSANSAMACSSIALRQWQSAACRAALTAIATGRFTASPCAKRRPGCTSAKLHLPTRRRSSDSRISLAVSGLTIGVTDVAEE